MYKLLVWLSRWSENKAISVVNSVDKVDPHYFDKQWSKRVARGTQQSGMYKEALKKTEPKKKSKWPNHGWE